MNHASGDHNQERIGEAMVLLESVILGLFPVLISYAGGKIPPILFAGSSALLGGCFLSFYLFATKSYRQLFHRQALWYSFGVTMFIIVIPSLFIFVGGAETTGINTSLLLQSEIVFTLLLCHFFFGEHVTKQKIGASMVIVLGTILILYNGTISLNRGDLFVILGAHFYPIGNRFAKQALKLVNPAVVLFIRSVLGGFILLGISFVFEGTASDLGTHLQKNAGLIAVTGIMTVCIAKIIWYEGLRRLDISKAIPMAMTYSAFGFVYSMLLLGERPTLYQFLGFLLVALGIVIITKKPKALTSVISENP